MFNEVLLVVCVLFGIGLGIVYNKFLIKDYPDHKRKTGYFLTIVVFLALTISIYSIISIKTYVNSVVKEYSIKLEQYLKDTYPENEFVKNGLDLKGLNNDISQINETISELKSILPTYRELGVDKIIYDLIVDYAIKELQKRLNVVNYSAKVINTFSDKNNVLTVSSITNGLRINAIKIVNTIEASSGCVSHIQPSRQA
jgi:predicted PurR-regulated permease PerM